MKEKEILKENKTTKQVVGEKPKKKYYKPRKKKETKQEEFTGLEIEKTIKVDKPNSITPIEVEKKVGKYCIGGGKGFCIHLSYKPNWLHRKFMKLFLGWTWKNND